MLKWFTILLALTGIAVGAWTVGISKRIAPELPPDRPPAINPYPQGIAAAGLVEAASRNIRIAAPEPGLVIRVLVNVNDRVKTGDVLFELDARALLAELERAKAAVEVAQSQLHRLESMPRPEDLVPLRAVVQRAEAQLGSAENERDSIQQMHAQKAATDFENRRSVLAADEAKARLAEARAELDRMLAGAWKSDLAVARATLAQAQAEVRGIEIRVERMSVRAPVDGVVLKRLIEPGEYCSPAAIAGTGGALVVGDMSSLNIRAQIDERDAPLLRQGSQAVAVLIGKQCYPFKLSMLRVEPMAVAKSQLSGSNTELVDTRVIEVLFKVVPDPGQDVQLYPGQLADVFIDCSAKSQP